MDSLLARLRAAGEPTRLRLLALCAHGELSVGELTEILAQSQPRVSRHLKLLVEAGLLERYPEGAQVFYRIAGQGEPAHFARTLVDLLPGDDTALNRDLARLDHIRARRAELAAVYFRENAAHWDDIRQMHVPENEVEACLKRVVGDAAVESLLDIGTGTGRILTLFAEQVQQAVGIDTSPAMLAVARAAIEKAGHRHVSVRKGDMYDMPLADQSVDLATLHLVLHYSLDPQRVLTEAARTLRAGGRLVIVDFAPHREEHLRVDHKHQRLGFSDVEIRDSLSAAGLQPLATEALVGEPLTVNIWQAMKAPLH